MIEPICRRAVVEMPVVEKTSVAKAVQKIVRMLTPDEAAEARRLGKLKEPEPALKSAQRVRKSAMFTAPGGQTVMALEPQRVLKNGDVIGIDKDGRKIYVKHG